MLDPTVQFVPAGGWRLSACWLPTHLVYHTPLGGAPFAKCYCYDRSRQDVLAFNTLIRTPQPLLGIILRGHAERADPSARWLIVWGQGWHTCRTGPGIDIWAQRPL